jgi:hypothetical protein
MFVGHGYLRKSNGIIPFRTEQTPLLVKKSREYPYHRSVSCSSFYVIDIILVIRIWWLKIPTNANTRHALAKRTPEICVAHASASQPTLERQGKLTQGSLRMLLVEVVISQ